MPFEQGMAGAELCEDLVVGHGGTAVPLNRCPAASGGPVEKSP